MKSDRAGIDAALISPLTCCPSVGFGMASRTRPATQWDMRNFTAVHMMRSLAFEFDESAKLFIRTHNETLSVAVRVNNPNRSSLRINGRDAAPTPSGFAEINRQ